MLLWRRSNAQQHVALVVHLMSKVSLIHTEIVEKLLKQLLHDTHAGGHGVVI